MTLSRRSSTCVCSQLSAGAVCQASMSPSAPAAATFAATSARDESAVLRPDREASRGPSSRRASKVVQWATGITRSVESVAESSFSATLSCSMLLSRAGLTRTIPMREFPSPLSISRLSRVPRGTTFSPYQADPPLDSRLLHSSAALRTTGSMGHHSVGE